MKLEDGILMLGRLSIGWNLHATRTVRTIALPIAVSWTSAPSDGGGDRLLLTVGPVTLIWLR